jgi:hypothetical protein
MSRLGFHSATAIMAVAFTSGYRRLFQFQSVRRSTVRRHRRPWFIIRLIQRQPMVTCGETFVGIAITGMTAIAGAVARTFTTTHTVMADIVINSEG